MTWREFKEHAKEITALVTLVVGMAFWFSWLAYQNQQNAADIAALKQTISGVKTQEAELRQVKDWKVEHGQDVTGLQKMLAELQTSLVEQRTLLKTMQETMQEVRQDVRMLMQRFWKPGVWRPEGRPWELKPVHRHSFSASATQCHLRIAMAAFAGSGERI